MILFELKINFFNDLNVRTYFISFFKRRTNSKIENVIDLKTRKLNLIIRFSSKVFFYLFNQFSQIGLN